MLDFGFFSGFIFVALGGCSMDCGFGFYLEFLGSEAVRFGVSVRCSRGYCH